MDGGCHGARRGALDKVPVAGNGNQRHCACLPPQSPAPAHPHDAVTAASEDEERRLERPNPVPDAVREHLLHLAQEPRLPTTKVVGEDQQVAAYGLAE